jgi:hypothetical protein
MKKSELKEIIKAAMSEDMGKSVFATNKPGRIGEFIKSLDSLVDEYHAELYLNDELFTALDAVKEAAQMEMGREDEMGDIPGFEGTRDALGGLGLEEAKKDEEEEEVEDVEVDAEEEITLDEPEEEEMDTDVEAPSAEGLSGDEKELQSNLEKALGAAKAMGDEKLSNQIGNTITFFTRTHVVGDTGNVEEVELNEENIGLADLEEMGYEEGEKAAYTYGTLVTKLQNKPDKLAFKKGFIQGVIDELGNIVDVWEGVEEEEVELNEEYTRMQKLAGITINEELYDFVKDIKNAVGLNQSLNNIEYYLGRDINDEERGALINAGVLRQVSDERYGSQYKKIQRRRY